MNKKIHAFAIVIWAIAAIIIVLGVIQIMLLINSINVMINDYIVQGYEEAEVTKYMWDQYYPQIFNYIVIFTGISAVVFASGLIYNKLCQIAKNDRRVMNVASSLGKVGNSGVEAEQIDGDVEIA